MHIRRAARRLYAVHVQPAALSPVRVMAVFTEDVPASPPALSRWKEGMRMSVPRFPKDQEKQIASWMESVKFRKQVFGGIRESDVWSKISELNDIYRKALLAERARYDALLAERGRRKGGG